MANYFDEIRAIVFAKGTKASKIEKLQSECKCTVYEANRYYMQLRPLMPVTERPEGRLRFTIGVALDFYTDSEAQTASTRKMCETRYMILSALLASRCFVTTGKYAFSGTSSSTAAAGSATLTFSLSICANKPDCISFCPAAALYARQGFSSL